MASRVLQELDAFERERRALLETVAGVDGTRLRARPGEGVWSLAEVIEHLVVAEREVLQGLPPRGELVRRRRGLRDRVRHRVVLFVLRRGFTVPVPSPTMTPAGGREAAELAAMWDENQAWLRAYLEATGGADPGAVFSHPVSGPIGVGETVHLLRTHLRSHLRDVRALGLEAGR